MKIDIKSWRTGEVLFSHECENNTVKITLEAGVKVGASLDGARLDGARLDGASLDGARLDGASLVGAYLKIKSNPIISIKQIGNIGSRGGYTVAYRCEKSIQINCGCFWGTLEEFEEKVKVNHGDNEHGREYMAMIAFLKTIWEPTEELLGDNPAQAGKERVCQK
jgi:hypothetical protein